MSNQGNSSEIIAQLEAAIRKLDDLEAAVGGDAIETQTVVANKTVAFADSLRSLHVSGKGMEELALFPVPRDLLELIDTNASNPDLYRISSYEAIENRCGESAKRLNYLQTLRGKVNKAIEATNKT